MESNMNLERAICKLRKSCIFRAQARNGFIFWLFLEPGDSEIKTLGQPAASALTTAQARDQSRAYQIRC